MLGEPATEGWSQAGSTANVTFVEVERAHPVAVQSPSGRPAVVVEGSTDVVVGLVSLDHSPDAAIYADGRVRVYVLEVSQYELSSVGEGEARNGSGNSSLVARTVEPALVDAYPSQLDTVSDGYVAVLEFNESNWQDAQEVRVSVTQDSFAEIDLVSVYLAFVAESPEVTQGTESMPNASALLWSMKAAAAGQNASRVESVVVSGFDVVVEDDDVAVVELRVESTDAHGVSMWDFAFPNATGVVYSTGLDLFGRASSVLACGDENMTASAEALAAGVSGPCVVLGEQEAAWLVVETTGGVPVFPVTVSLSVSGLGGSAPLLVLSESIVELSEFESSALVAILS